MENYIATNIKFLRENNNLSQEQLGSMLEKPVHHTTVGRWETKKIDPSVENAIMVADAFNIPIADLIGRDLRIKNSVTPDNIDKQIFKDVLIKKGYMEKGKDITNEKYDELLKIEQELEK